MRGPEEGQPGVRDDAFVDARPVTHAGAATTGAPTATGRLVGLEPRLEPGEPPPEVRRTLRLSFFEGGLVQVFINWTMGSVLIGYLLALGATPLHIALVGSVGFLAQMSSPVAAWVAELVGRRRVLNAALATAGRASWLVAVLLPQLPVPDGARPTILVGLVFVAGVFNAAAATTWTAWMGDVVPEDRRGTFFGRRNGIMGVVGMAANLGGGAFLDRLAPPLSFQVVLAVAVACGLAGAALILLHHDPAVEGRRLPFGTVLLAPLQNDDFRRFLRFAVYWQFVVMLSNPFTTAYFLESLEMSFTQVAVYTSLTAAA
ncbi:MAG TPA: MFS transporter, partial [Longimicrobiales bacterium]